MGGRWPSMVNGMPVPYGRPLSELQSLTESATPQRWVAIVAMARVDGDEPLARLADLAASRDPCVRRAAVEAIGLRVDGGRLSAVVLERLRDANEYVVRTAIEVAAALGMVAAREDLLRLLKHPEAATRTAAVRALADLWEEDAFNTVLGLFRGDPAAGVRKEAGWTLRSTVSAAHSQVLVQLWAADAVPRHRLWACEVARLFPRQEFREIVSRLKDDPDGHVRRAAREASGKLGGPTTGCS